VIEQRDLPSIDHFAAEMDHMSNCVMENQQPLTPGEEGMRDLSIIDSIYESARSQKMVTL
jgi:predicted dehydrogenase